MVKVCSSCMVCGAPRPLLAVNRGRAKLSLGFSGLVPAGEVGQPGAGVAAVEDGAEPARALCDGAAEPVAGVGRNGGAEPDVVGDGLTAVALHAPAAPRVGGHRPDPPPRSLPAPHPIPGP